MRIVAVVLAGFLTGCAIARGVSDRGSCEFVVYNRTSYALDVRAMRDTTGRSVAASVGTINPGEAITDRAPCALGAVWLRGYTLPVAIGMPARYPYVDGWVDLLPGTKATVWLSYP